MSRYLPILILITSAAAMLAGGEDARADVSKAALVVTVIDTVPPLISDVHASIVSSNSVDIIWETDERSDSQVEIGLDTNYGYLSPLDTSLVLCHSLRISPLVGSVTYHYRVKSRDKFNNLRVSADYTFSTPADLTPPLISDVEAYDITPSAASITWCTDEFSNSRVRYGADTSCAISSALMSDPVTTHMIYLNALSANTMYYYRALSEDLSGNLARSGLHSFTTPPPMAAPEISNVQCNDITPTTAVIEWQTDIDSDSQVEYGLSPAYGSITPVNPTLTTEHEIALSGLRPNSQYHFRVISKNQYGDSSLSADNCDLITTELAAPNVTGAAIHQRTHLMLTWVPATHAKGYNVYRDVTPFFRPDTALGSNRVATNACDEDPELSGVQWIDQAEVIGDETTNYFYAVTSVIDSVESDFTTRIGEFDYRLITTAKTDFNEIALPLHIPGVSNAAQLMAAIHGCTSVARWNAAWQGYEQYIPGIPPTNFAVEMGYPYYVNVTVDTVFTLVGEIASPSFALVTTPTTDFNDIMLTLDRTGISKASHLMDDIPGCNAIARWNAVLQGYEQYIPGIPPTDFSVKIGYPYYVNVTADVVWPEGGIPKVAALTTTLAGKEESKAPHAVYGCIRADGDSVALSGVGYIAYITSRPGEKLSHRSAGCALLGEHWIVQCGSFPSPWRTGEILRVEFQGGEGSLRGEIDVQLSYEALDDAGEILLTDYDIPRYYEFSQNYPNPFNACTSFKYQIPEQAHVTIRIYNMLGQEIGMLRSEVQQAGYYSLIWDGKDMYGNPVSDGIYFVQIATDKYSQIRKMILVK